MDTLIAILVALISSGIISTTLNLYAHRWQPDHQSSLLAAWENEVSLLSVLESGAKNQDLSASIRKRYSALAIAGEAQMVSATAQRLVPRNSVFDASKIIGGFLLLLLGGLAGAPFSYYLLSTGTGDPNAAVVLLIYSITIALMGITFILAGWLSATYRDVMRSKIIEILKSESSSSWKYGGTGASANRGFRDYRPGTGVNFTNFARFALPRTQRRLFSDFVEFSTPSDRHSQQDGLPNTSNDFYHK